jgi:hypothetical protein
MIKTIQDTSGLTLFFLVVLLILAGFSGTAQAVVSAPVLKWQHRGCFSSWCETGWYSSPAVEDLGTEMGTWMSLLQRIL